MDEPAPSNSELCPNCGWPRTGPFCSRCGQNDKDYLRAFRDVAAEMLSETFELDSRLVRTVGALVVKPGYLTREFVAGRRASYMSPVRLYIVTSVIFFLLLSVFGEFNVSVDARDAVPAGEAVESPEHVDAGREAALGQGWGLRLDAPENVDSDALREKLMDNFPMAMFLLLPVFALVLKLLYPRRFYTEHLVFGLHLHAFHFLLFGALVLIPEPAAASSGVLDAVLVWLRTGLLLGGLVYWLVALKVAYGQSLALTAVKFVLLFNVNAALVTGAIVAAYAWSLLF